MNLNTFGKGLLSLLIIILTLVILPPVPVGATVDVITSTIDGGPWSDGSTWVGGIPPDGDDSVVIATQDGAVVSLEGETTIRGSLTINSGAELVTNNNKLVLEGDFINHAALPLDAGSSQIFISGTADQNIGGFTTIGNVYMTKTGGVATLTGNITAEGLIMNGPGGTLHLGSGRLHTLNGTWTRTAGTLDGGSSTLKLKGGVSGTTATFVANMGTVNFGATGSQTIPAETYYNLITSGSGNKTLAGALAVNNKLTVNPNTTLVVGTNNISVNGATSISGAVTQTTGTKVYHGLVTVNGSGVWTNSGDVTFRGGLIVNNIDPAKFTAGTGLYTFDTNNQSIGGLGIVSIPNVNIASGATLTNNGQLTVSNSISGEGALTQGATGVLNIGAVDANFATSVILNAATAGNTVNYSAMVGQKVRAIPYHHLTLSGSGAKDLTGVTTINGNLTLGGMASSATLADFAVGGNLLVGSGTTLTIGEYAFSVSGTTGVLGTLAFGSPLGIKTFNNTVTVNSGGTWNNTSGAAVTFHGGLTHNGATFSAGTSLYTFETNNQATGGTASLSIPNLVVSGGVTLTNNANLSVTNSLGGEGTLTQGAGGILNIGVPGSITLITLNASEPGNTVNYSASGDQVIRPIPYHHLTLSGSGAKDLTGLTTVNGSLTLSGAVSAVTQADLAIGSNLAIGSGTSLTVGEYAFSVEGTTSVTGALNFGGVAGLKLLNNTVTVNPGGTWNNAGGTAVTFHGGLTHNGANFTSGTGLYTFDTNNQVIGGTRPATIANLAIPAGITITNNLTGTGVLAITTSLAGEGALTQGVNSNLSIGVPGSFTLTTLNASAAGNTVNYNASVDQSVRAIPYQNLTLSGSGAKDLTGLTTVNGNLLLSGSGTTATTATVLTIGGKFSTASGTTFNANHAMFVSGDWSDAGTFNPAAGNTVTLQGSGTQTFSNRPNFENLTINKPTGEVVLSEGVTLGLSGETTVNGTLTLTSGRIVTGIRNMNIKEAGSVAGGSPNSYVYGNLRKYFLSGSGPDFTFAIGDVNAYTPVNLSSIVVATSVLANNYVTATTTAGEHPEINSSLIDPAKDVNRYWSLVPGSGITFTSYNVTLNFTAGDVDAGANPANFVIQKYSDGWTSPTLDTRTSTSTKATNLSSMSTYAIGETESIPPMVTNVTSTTPDGYYNTPDGIVISVTFSEPVYVTGVPQLTLETGAVDRVLDYAAGTGTATLTFNYTVQAGDTSGDLDYAASDPLALNGGQITDLAGNHAVLNLPVPGTAGSLGADKALVVDTTAPETQIDSRPADPANNTSANFTFSSPGDAAATFECSLDEGAFSACAVPYVLAEGPHTIAVQAIDLAGNVDPSPATYAWTIDVTAPTVVSSKVLDPSPTSLNKVRFSVVFSEAVNGVDPADFSLTATVKNASILSVTPVSADQYTVLVNTGSGNGALLLNVQNNMTITDAALNPLAGAFTGGEAYTVKKTLVFKSVGVYDGWILESTATSSVGGTMNSSATTFNVGDDKSKKQYLAILDFNTAGLPDNAVITSITLKVKKYGLAGSDPFKTHGYLLVDIKKPYFATKRNLELGDFQAVASKASAGKFGTTPVSNWYSAVLTASKAYINLTGTTQMRLRFAKPNDTDLVADYVKFYSGGSVTNAPQLIINYYVPAP